MLPKRWVRQLARIVTGITVLIGMVILADFYLNFLPATVQTRLPLHIPSPVVVDIEVRTCYRASACSPGTDGWHKHTKNLFLGQNWFEKAFVYTKRIEENELTGSESVLLDLALPYENAKVVPQRILDDITRNNPELTLDSLDNERNRDLAAALGWSLKDAKHGLWIKMGKYRPGYTISEVKVLFSENALYPIPGWKLLEGGIQNIGNPIPRLAIRRGAPGEMVRPELKFDKDGNFKIVQLADLHMSTDDGKCDHPVGLEDGERCVADLRTIEFVREILDREKPDLVVFTGDQIMGDQAPDAETAMLKAIGPVISRELPWTLVFGNHDKQSPLKNRQLMELSRSLPGCLSSAGNVTGVGNYMLGATVNGHRALSMYFMDSHAHLQKRGPPEYDWIHKDQLQLMKDLKKQADKETEKYAHIPVSMAFFHIPLPEYRNIQDGIVGKHREQVMGPVYNSGTLDVLSELGVSVASVGHDHCNDYCLQQKDTWLCYGGSAGDGAYGGYPDETGDTQRRIRVYQVNSQDSSIYSWKWVRGATDKLDVQKLVVAGKPVSNKD